MNTMTKAQKDYINNVIRPVLIQMAIDDELPSDMNEIGYHHFEKATEEYNASPEQQRQKQIDNLAQYVSDHELSVEEQLEALEKADDDQCISGVIDLCEHCEDMGSLTVDKFYRDYL